MNKNLNNLTGDALRRAADLSDDINNKQAELDKLQGELDNLQAELNTIFVGSAAEVKVRKLSPEAIAKIREGQKRRWDKVRAEKAATEVPVEAPVAA